MIDLAKYTGIIGGLFSKLCMLAVSSRYAGKGYNGAPDPTALTNNGTPVYSNDGINLDGSSYIDCTNDSRFDFTEFCIVFRFKTTSTLNRIIIGKSRFDSFYINLSNGTLQFWTGYNGSCVSSMSTLNDGKWHTCACSYKDGTRKIYIDGALDNTTGSSVYRTDTRPVLIAASYNQYSESFIGSLDDIFIFNQAFDDDEVIGIHKFLGA